MTEVFVSKDHRVAVAIPRKIRRGLLHHCRRAGVKETGGILIGHYTDLRDRAVVTEATGPPLDSIARRFSFVRGLVGLQARVNRAWRRNDYYLGEWHFHPFASPKPSGLDLAQTITFAKDPQYRCPEPILVVVGGNPEAGGVLSISLVIEGEAEELSPWPSTKSGSARRQSGRG